MKFFAITVTTEEHATVRNLGDALALVWTDVTANAALLGGPARWTWTGNVLDTSADRALTSFLVDLDPFQRMQGLCQK
jgi:hypothetical protein